MAVTADGFRRAAARIASLADEVCHGQLVALHEGGYSDGYAPVCTSGVVEGLSGIRSGYEDPYAGG